MLIVQKSVSDTTELKNKIFLSYNAQHGHYFRGGMVWPFWAIFKFFFFFEPENKMFNLRTTFFQLAISCSPR
jgi:hypothetical protein